MQDNDALAARAVRRPAEALDLHRALQSHGLASSSFARFIESTSPRMFEDTTGKNPRVLVGDQRFSGRTFFYFTVKHYIRHGAIQLVTHPVYQGVMVLLILLSTVTLTMQPTVSHRQNIAANGDLSPTTVAFLVLDRLLSIVFFLEFVVEFVAVGVLKTLRYPEYFFDLIIITCGILLDATTDPNVLTFLLVVSSLRPVRIVRRIAGLRRLLRYIASGGILLVNVFLLIFCIMLALAVAGVIFFAEAEHTRCYDPAAGTFGSLCSTAVTGDKQSVLFASCPDGTVCLQGAPTLSQYESFDHIGYSLLIQFQLFTLDNWTGITVDLMNGLSPAAGLFFVLATFMLAYWSTNLLTAVVLWAFQEQFKAEQENEREIREKEKSRQADFAKSFRDKLLEQLAVRQSSPVGPQAPSHSARGLRNAKAAQVIGDFKRRVTEDAVQSLRNGYPSVKNVDEILRAVHDDFQRENELHAAEDVDSDDYVLNEQGMEIELRDAVELEKLERAIRQSDPAVFEALQTVKNGRYDSEKDQLRVIRYFIYMDEVTRQKLVRTIQWREELFDSTTGSPDPSSSYEPPILVVPSLATTPGKSATMSPRRQSLANSFKVVPPGTTDVDGLFGDMGCDVEMDSRNSSTDSFVSRHSELDSEEEEVRISKLRRRVTTHEKERRIQAEHKRLWKKAAPIIKERIRRKKLALGLTPKLADEAGVDDKGKGNDEDGKTKDDLQDTRSERSGLAFNMNDADNDVEIDDEGLLLGDLGDDGTDKDSIASLIRRHNRINAREERRRLHLEGDRLADRFNPLKIDVGNTISNFASATMSLAKATANLARATATLATEGVRAVAVAAGAAEALVDSSPEKEASEEAIELQPPGAVIAPPHELHHFHSVASKFEEIEDRRKVVKQLRRLIQKHNDENDVPREIKKLSLWERLKEKWEAQGFKERTYDALRDPSYDRALAILCTANITLLAAVHYEQPWVLGVFVTWVTGATDAVMLLDAAARMYILGSLRSYFKVMTKSLYNTVEMVVVVLCFIDLFLVIPGLVPVLSCLRVLRMIKYVRFFTQLRKILLLCRSSVGYLFNLLVIFALFLFVFTVAGHQMFGGSYSVSTHIVSCGTHLDQRSCNLDPTMSCVWVTTAEYTRHDNNWFGELLRCYNLTGGAPPCRHTLSESKLSITSSQSKSTATAIHLRPRSHTLGTSSRTYSASADASKSLSLSRDAQKKATDMPTVAPPPPSSSPSDHLVPFSEERRCRQFRGWLDDNADFISRFSFESLLLAFVTVFDVITRDQWSAIQYQFMNAVGPHVCLYFISALILGSYIILSVLVAVLLVNFEQQSHVTLDQLEDIFTSMDKEVLRKKTDLYDTVLKAQHRQEYENTLKEQQMEEARKEREKLEAEQAAIEQANLKLQQEKLKKKQHQQEAAEATTASAAATAATAASEAQLEISAVASSVDGKADGAAGATAPTAADDTAELLNKKKRGNAALAKQLFLDGATVVRNNIFVKLLHLILMKIINFCDIDDTKIDKRTLQGKSLFLFSSTNKYRLFAVDVVSGKYFRVERTVFWLSVLHCIVSPATPNLIDSDETLVAFSVIDWVLMVLSAVEMLFRVTAQGGFIGSQSYLRTGKDHAVDFAVVVLSFFANMLPLLAGGKAARVGFALKGIRPGRIVPRSRTMRNVLIAVLKTAPDMGNIFFLSTVVYFMFSIICVDLFNGRFRICNDGSDRSQAECIGTWVGTANDNVFLYPPNATQMYISRHWTNTQWFHFDDVWNAFTSLLQVSMVSTWSPVMFASIDAPSNAGGSPVRNRNVANAAWMIVWAIASNFFLLNVFIGTVVDRFTALKNQMQGSVFATEDQSVVATIKKALGSKSAKKVLCIPEIPFLNQRMNEVCYQIVMNPYFMNSVKVLVYANVLTIFTIHYAQSTVWTNIQFVSNIVIAAVFLIEASLKIGISGFENYFAIPTLRIDAVICFLAIVDVIVALSLGSLQKSTWMEALRLIRLVRIARDLKGFRKLVESGITALPAIGNIGALLVSIMYLFSMIGISLFASIRYDTSGQWFAPMFSFKTLPKAMFLLYTVATFDDWSQVEVIAGVKAPYCSNAPEIDNCGTFWVANIFLNVYVIFVGVIGLNLFIAVVLETFNETILVPTYVQVRLNDIDTFRTAWRDQDPQARMVIHASKFVPLLLSLSGPELRFKELKERRDHAGDNDSLKSWTTQEIFVYSQRQVIGLKGCPSGVIIPTVSQLRLYVTLPREEILFNDALDAVAEKIFHAPIADERVRRAEEMIRERGSETRVLFAKWYAAEAIKRIWRRLKRERWDNKDYRPVSHLWSTAVDPLIKAYVKQHHRTAWTVVHDESLRKESVHKKRKDKSDATDKTSETGSTSLPISRSLAEIVKTRQVDVEELPEVQEDLRWMGVVNDVDSASSDSDVSWSDEELWLTQAGRQERKKVLKQLNLLSKSSKRSQLGDTDPRRSVKFELPSRVDESGSICHYASLDEVIRFQRTQLLFQLRAQLYAEEFQRRQSGVDAAATPPLTLPTVEQYTTVEMREMLKGKVIDIVTWTDAKRQWRPRKGLAATDEPPEVWRPALSIPLQLRPQTTRRRAVPVRQGQRSEKFSWDNYFAVRNPLLSEGGGGGGAAQKDPSGDPQGAGDQPQIEEQQAKKTKTTDTEPRKNLVSGEESVRGFDAAGDRHPPVLLDRLPTLEEEMERRGLPTTHMKQAAAAKAVAASGQQQQQLQQQLNGGLLQERITLKSLMLSADEPLNSSYVPRSVDVTYSIPQNDDAGDEILGRLSFNIMMRLSLCAARFKRRKQREAERALQAASQRVVAASSMYSRATKNTAKKKSGGGLHRPSFAGDESAAEGSPLTGVGAAKGLVTAGFSKLTGGMKDMFRRKKADEELDDEF